MTNDRKSDLLKKLTRYEQTHLLDFWEQLSPQGQQQLAAQIENLDLDAMQKLVKQIEHAEDWGALAAQAESPPAIRLDDSQNPYSREEAWKRGTRALQDGKVGVILVAGGQGTRLGFPHPKGMFPLGPVSQRTLFEIHADRIIAASQRYGVTLPLYVMTSPATHQETVDYFAEHDNCGLPELRIFCQGTMPAVDAATGQLLLEAPDRLCESPDGHGGTLAALVRSGCLEEIKSNGIEQLFYLQVDNPLVDIGDPAFIGYHLLAGSEMTSQVIAKTDPQEKVGVVVAVDGVLRIIEYSDLPDEQAERRNADGSLSIWAGSIAVHVFDVAFLDRVKDSADALPFHRAHKIVPFLDSQGKRIEPVEPNAIKFERFIFDLLPLAKNGLVVEVDAADAFAPLKNARGAAKDTAETAQAAMLRQHRKWLEAAGVEVAAGARIEINPRFAADVAELRTKLSGGIQLDGEMYFGHSK